MLKVASIDVGSNAVRMTGVEVDDSTKVRAIDNISLLVRAGATDVTGGMLEETSMQRTVEAFHRFQHVAEDFGVYRLRAVATSAMREAGNGILLTERILSSSGIK